MHAPDQLRSRLRHSLRIGGVRGIDNPHDDRSRFGKRLQKIERAQGGLNIVDRCLVHRTAGGRPESSTGHGSVRARICGMCVWYLMSEARAPQEHEQLRDHHPDQALPAIVLYGLAIEIRLLPISVNSAVPLALRQKIGACRVRKTER